MADTVEELKRQLQMALAQNEKLKQENSQLKKSHDQDVSNMQGRINTLLADKLKNEDRIAKLTSDNQKLTIHKHNMETVHINILRTIEENSIVYNRLLKRIPFPAVDDYIGLENYYQNIVSTLTRCYATLQYHQTRSLGLGTSEKTHGRNEEEPDEDDANDCLQVAIDAIVHKSQMSICSGGDAGICVAGGPDLANGDARHAPLVLQLVDGFGRGCERAGGPGRRAREGRLRWFPRDSDLRREGLGSEIPRIPFVGLDGGVRRRRAHRQLARLGRGSHDGVRLVLWRSAAQA